MKQGVDTPSLRRSSRVRRSFTVFTPENDKQVTRKNPIARCENVKRKHESLEAKHEQEEPHLAPSGDEMHKSSEVEQEEQQSHLAPSGKIPRKMRKSSKFQQGVDTPNLRRSSRVHRSFTVFTPENDKQVTRKNPIARCGNVKRKHESLPAKHEQEEPHLAPSGHEMLKSLEVEYEQQEPHLAPSGHEMHESLEVEHEQQELPLTPSVHDSPPIETRGEVPVVELPLSPEEEKPKFDLLFLLEHAVKPNSQQGILPEDRQHLVNAASVLKSQLVARLTSSAANLKTEDMIDLANRCFRALRELGDDYRSFNKDVNKFISQQQEVEFAAKDVENWNDWDLRARYSHQEQLMSDVTEKLFSAQDELSRTTSHADYLKFKKDELTSALLMVTEDLSKEEQKIETLAVERDKCKEVQFDIEVGLEKLDAKKKEARVALEAINAQYDAAKEEFERMGNYLVQLVRSSRTGKAST